MKKRLIFTAALLCGMIALTSCSKTPETPKQPITSENSVNEKELKVSQMDETKCRQYLEDAGIDVSGYDISEIRRTLSELEDDPNHQEPIASFIDIIINYEQMRVFVNMYYNKVDIPQNIVLSKMGEDECIQFLKDVGVEIPYNYNISTIQNILANLEDNHNYSVSDNVDLPRTKLYAQLRVVVNMYYK